MPCYSQLLTAGCCSSTPSGGGEVELHGGEGQLPGQFALNAGSCLRAASAGLLRQGKQRAAQTQDCASGDDESTGRSSSTPPVSGPIAANARPAVDGVLRMVTSVNR